MQSESRVQKNKYRTYFYISLFAAVLLACILGFNIINSKSEVDTKSLANKVNDVNDSALVTEVLTPPMYEKIYTSTSGENEVFTFPDYDKNTKEAEMQRLFVNLDHKTRMIHNFIQKDDLEKINELAIDYDLTGEGKIIFLEMDYPSLAISPEMLQSSYPLQLANGTQQGDYFSFHYFLLSDNKDESHMQLFVQYQRINDEWILVNLRTNH